MILWADSESPDQTARMRRLIWAFAVRTCPKTCFRMDHIWVIFFFFLKNRTDMCVKRRFRSACVYSPFDQNLQGAYRIARDAISSCDNEDWSDRVGSFEYPLGAYRSPYIFVFEKYCKGTKNVSFCYCDSPVLLHHFKHNFPINLQTTSIKDKGQNAVTTFMCF